MRLTNVSQMRVQPGRLFSYALSTTAPGPDSVRLPVSFDQARHVGFGSRHASWMAVSFKLPVHAPLELIAEAWHHVLSRHGTLRTVFLPGEASASSAPAAAQAHDDDPGTQCGGPQTDLQLVGVEVLGGAWEELADDEPLTPDEIRRTLQEHFDTACDCFARPSHRLCVVLDPAGQRSPQIVIGSDHAHVDAWSLLVLARDLSACVEDLRAGRRPGRGLPAAESFAAHSAHLQQRPFPPVEVVTRWREILDAGGGSMPQFPLELGALTPAPPEVVEIRDVFDAEELAHVEAYAAEHQVRLIALAVSVMTRLAAELSDQPLRAVFPVHSRDDARWYDSVGWFITNSVLENDDAGYRASYAAVKEAIRLGSYPLAPIMRPYGGMPQSPGMFAMSWLDHRKLPVNVDEHLEPQHVSAVTHTDGVMIWFVINASGLHLRCRYPDTRQARRSIRTWLAGLVYGLRAPLERSGFPGS
ncbi:peptide synthetase [Nesterenkonia alba]|uniref:peptide synthetase n=1 Tax=Nesterenkonia alba TaxID=515814 RepID=UPI0003B3DFC2|nr:peptide synthetase [Nesterenkonia alba]